jgi:hypothetical protein
MPAPFYTVVKYFIMDKNMVTHFTEYVKGL